MIRKFEREHGPSFKTITADNGSEFHSYEVIERCTGATFDFATPLPLLGARLERERERPDSG